MIGDTFSEYCEYVQFVDVTIGERHCALPPLHDEVLLTARHVQVAGLLVQGEEGEVHGAGARDGDPAT